METIEEQPIAKKKVKAHFPWMEAIMKEHGMKKCDVIGIRIPKCVSVTRPEVPESKSHEYTVEITLKWPCEWEGQKDDNGNFIAGTIQAVGWETRNSFHCLPKSTSLKDICAIIRDKEQDIKESDASQQ